MKKLEGLIAAPYTPFDHNGDVNIDLIPSYAHYLKAIGVSGVFVNGTTGEGLSLRLEERKQLAAAWVSQKSAHFQVLIHVGHSSIRSAQDLSAHAEMIEADGFGSMATAFFKPADLATLVDHNLAIAKAAPSLPFFYYHLPSMTGVHFPMIDFLEMAHTKIPNLAGIKYTHEDLMDMKLCLEYADQKYQILHGRDEILICGMTLGIKAAIGSTYNYLAPLFKRITAAFGQGDLQLANELQFVAIRIIRVLIKYGGGVKAGKSIMQMVGLDFGAPRSPVTGLKAREVDAMRKELEALDFQKYSLHSSEI